MSQHFRFSISESDVKPETPCCSSARTCEGQDRSPSSTTAAVDKKPCSISPSDTINEHGTIIPPKNSCCSTDKCKDNSEVGKKQLALPPLSDIYDVNGSGVASNFGTSFSTSMALVKQMACCALCLDASGCCKAACCLLKCCGISNLPSSFSFGASNKPVDTPGTSASGAERDARLSVLNMDCTDCSSTLERVCRKRYPGILDITVSVMTEQAVLRYDANMVQLKDIIDTIISLGYPSRVLTDRQHIPSSERSVSIVSMDHVARISVLNMDCTDCAQKIENRCKKEFANIVDISVSVMTEQAVVRYDPASTDIQQVVATIKQLGYPSRLIVDRPVQLSVVDKKQENGGRVEPLSVRIELNPKIGAPIMDTSTMATHLTAVLSADGIDSMSDFMNVPKISGSYYVDVFYDPQLLGPRRVVNIIGSALQSFLVKLAPASANDKSSVSSLADIWWKRFIISFVLCLPVIFFAYLVPDDVLSKGITDALDSPKIRHVTIASMISFIFTTPIQFYGGWPLFTSSYRAIYFARTLNMDCLVILSTSIAYFYSAAVLLGNLISTSRIEERDSFETSAVLITVILFGRWIEARAKSKASSSLEHLASMQATTATLMNNWKDDKLTHDIDKQDAHHGHAHGTSDGNQHHGHAHGTSDGNQHHGHAHGPSDGNQHHHAHSHGSKGNHKHQEHSHSHAHCEKDLGHGHSHGPEKPITKHDHGAEHGHSHGPSTHNEHHGHAHGPADANSQHDHHGHAHGLGHDQHDEDVDGKESHIELISLTSSNVTDGVEEVHTTEIDARLLERGDVVKVVSGSKIPSDGTVVAGLGEVDEASVTGESIAVVKSVGSSVYGGTINRTGVLYVQITKTAGENTLAAISQLVAQAQSGKAKVQVAADRMAAWFVPLVVVVSLAVLIIWLAIGAAGLVVPPSGSSSGTFALQFFLSVLVVSCPCAIGLAVAPCVMVATGVATRYGIIFKGGPEIENTHKITDIVFDKTGTLTEGKPTVSHVLLVDTDSPSNNAQLADFWFHVGSCELGSEHVLGRCLVDHARSVLKSIKSDLVLAEPSDFESLAGKGVRALVQGTVVSIGSLEFVDDLGLISSNDRVARVVTRATELRSSGLIAVWIRIGDTIRGAVVISDVIRDDAVEIVATLQHTLGIRVWLMSGDSTLTTAAVAKLVGIPPEQAIGQMLPADKAAKVVELQQDAGKVVAMVGDGVNDSPALAAASVGIAMGGGTDVAMHTAGVILLNNRLEGILTAIYLSRFTFSTIRLNLIWAFLYNCLAIIVSSGSLYTVSSVRLPPAFAGLAELLSSLPVLLFALHINRFKTPTKSDNAL